MNEETPAVNEKNQRLDEWKSLIDGLRQRHKAKQRPPEVPDTLSNRKIAG